jgi:uroporphyrinogen-III decarboxylase
MSHNAAAISAQYMPYKRISGASSNADCCTIPDLMVSVTPRPRSIAPENCTLVLSCALCVAHGLMMHDCEWVGNHPPTHFFTMMHEVLEVVAVSQGGATSVNITALLYIG